MDTITHTIVGAVAVKASFKKPADNDKPLFLTAIIASAFPDIDNLTFLINPLLFLAEWHRSITHSFVMLPLWAILIGVTMSMIFRKKDQWRLFTICASIALATHILTDIITVYGTKILAPLWDYEASIGTTFVVDGYFTGIVVASLVLYYIFRKNKNSTLLPLAGLLLIAVYISTQSFLKENAISAATQNLAQSIPSSAVTTAIPQPFSPFNWKVIIQTEQEYLVSHIDLFNNPKFTEFTKMVVSIITAKNSTLLAMVDNYKATHKLEWKTFPRITNISDKDVTDAWHHKDFSPFRKFAHYPIIYRRDTDCIWFTDIRYMLPILTPSFRYGMCNNNNNWSLYRLRRFTQNQRQKIS